MSLRTTVTNYKEAIRVIQDIASGEISENMVSDIILKVAETHPGVLVHARNSIRAGDTQFGRLSQSTIEATVIDFLKADRKIQAIKFLRAATGTGLRPAKDEVDGYQRRMERADRYEVDRFMESKGKRPI